MMIRLWHNGFYYGLMMAGLALLPMPVRAQADFVVQKVVFSKSIHNKNPEGIFTPPAYCEKDKNGQASIPVIQASQASEVFLWVKVEANVTGKLRHSWHFQTEGTWTKVSEVNLSVRPSPGYRTWSKKRLRPEGHIGDWMVVISPSEEPERVLCITRFSVK